MPGGKRKRCATNEYEEPKSNKLPMPIAVAAATEAAKKAGWSSENMENKAGQQRAPLDAYGQPANAKFAWVDHLQTNHLSNQYGGGSMPGFVPAHLCNPAAFLQEGSYLMNHLSNHPAGISQNSYPNVVPVNGMKTNGSPSKKLIQMSEESYRNIYTPLILGPHQTYLQQIPPYNKHLTPASNELGYGGAAPVPLSNYQQFIKQSTKELAMGSVPPLPSHAQQTAEQRPSPAQKPTRQITRRSTILSHTRVTGLARPSPAPDTTTYETKANHQVPSTTPIGQQQQQQASFASIYASQTWLNPELVLQQTAVPPNHHQQPQFYFTDRRMSTGLPSAPLTSESKSNACNLKRSMTTVRRRGRPPKNAAALAAAAAIATAASSSSTETIAGTTSVKQETQSNNALTNSYPAVTSKVPHIEQPSAQVHTQSVNHQSSLESISNHKENNNNNNNQNNQNSQSNQLKQPSNSSPSIKKSMSKRATKSFFAKCSSTSNLQRNKVSTAVAEAAGRPLDASKQHSASAAATTASSSCTLNGTHSSSQSVSKDASASISQTTNVASGVAGTSAPPAKSLKQSTQASEATTINHHHLPSSMLTPYQSNNNLLVLSDVLNIMNNSDAKQPNVGGGKHREEERTTTTAAKAKTTLETHEVSDSDSNDSTSLATPMPQLTWANNNELWQAMLKKDAKYVHDPFYLKRHLGIEAQMRAILLDWLVEICYAYKLHRETFHLACEYMDRFLSCTKQQMKVDRLQLVGMTSLFLAAKVEEIYPPKLKELASHMESYSNNNEEAISQFELFMLKTLNWEISPVTANTWLMTYLHIAAINSFFITDSKQIHNAHLVMPLHIERHRQRTHSLAHPATVSQTVQMLRNASTAQQQFYLQNYMKCVTLLDLCMFDMESLKFSYSMLAAAALYHMVSKPILPAGVVDMSNLPNDHMTLVTNLVQRCTGFRIRELDSCIKWMHSYAEICLEKISEEKLIKIHYFQNIDADDAHNIQLYYQNLELLKEAQCRKSPSKLYSSLKLPMTPPESSSSSVGHTSLLSTSTTSLLNYNN